MSNELQVVDEPQQARALLHEVRLELLRQLDEPASAATLARRLELPRQRVNYHLRELEAHALVELVEERRRGSATERIYRRAGQSYTLSNAALGPLGSDPDELEDRFSSAYQIALASRAVEELGALRAGAAEAGQRLPTFALDVAVRFADAERRNAFADALAAAVADLVREYHDDRAPRGRTFRFTVGGYPLPKGKSTRE